MAELFHGLQGLLLTAADTVNVWRDAAVLVLAGLVIVLLTLVAVGRPDA